MSFWSSVRDLTGGVYDAGSSLLHGAGDIVSGGVKAVRGITGGLAGGIENATGLNLKDPATIAALGLAAYGFYNPEAFGLGAAAGTGEGATAAEAAAAGGESGSMLGTTAGTTAGTGSTLGNTAFTSELPAGYTPGSVDALVSSAGPGTNIAAVDTGSGATMGGSVGPATYGTADVGNYGYDMGGSSAAATNAGSTSYGSNLPMTGADYEQMPANMPAYSAVNAPLASYSPGIMENIAAGNYGQALGDIGSEAWQGIKENKLATAMVGSSLYDMYAKRQMAKKQDELYNQNRADILGMYAPGSPEAKAMEQQMARQDAAAGRNSQYGIRATDYAANVAKFKANALAQAANAQSGLAAAQMGNQYGGLNSMFNNLAMYSLLNKSTK